MHIAVERHLLAVAFAVSAHVAVPLAQTNQVRFSWAIAVRPAGTSSVDAIAPSTTVQRGDHVGLYVSARVGFVYIVQVDSTGAARLHFPTVLKDAGAPATLPERWIDLGEHKGNEVFHVLASHERLDTVEALVRQPGSRTGEQLALEVQRLRRAHSNLRAPAERPVLMGGRVRGGPDLRSLAVDVVATGFYARTIQVEHQ